jgi:hypothetical protein
MRKPEAKHGQLPKIWPAKKIWRRARDLSPLNSRDYVLIL